MKKMMLFLILMAPLFNGIATQELEEDQTKNMKSAFEIHENYREELRLNRLRLENLERTKGFLKALSERESSGNPNVVNSYGYIGKYQFGKAALSDAGYGHIDIDKFKSNPSIFSEEDQDDAVIKLLKLNRKRLDKFIDVYEGRTINGILITESGLLAAAHLAGAGGVQRFLRSNGRYNPSDGYGTRLTTYLDHFKDYDIKLDYV